MMPFEFKPRRFEVNLARSKEMKELDNYLNQVIADDMFNFAVHGMTIIDITESLRTVDFADVEVRLFATELAARESNMRNVTPQKLLLEDTREVK